MSALASAWMCQWSNVPPDVVAPVVCRHHFTWPSTRAASDDTCAPVSRVHQKCPAVSAALYSASEAMTWLPVPMPRRLVIGLENTGYEGGITSLRQCNGQFVVNPAICRVPHPGIRVFGRDQHIVRAWNVLEILESPRIGFANRHRPGRLYVEGPITC